MISLVRKLIKNGYTLIEQSGLTNMAVIKTEESVIFNHIWRENIKQIFDYEIKTEYKDIKKNSSFKFDILINGEEISSYYFVHHNTFLKSNVYYLKKFKNLETERNFIFYAKLLQG